MNEFSRERSLNGAGRDLNDLPDGWVSEGVARFGARKRRRMWGWLLINVGSGLLAWGLVIAGLTVGLFSSWLAGAAGLVLALICAVISVATDARCWACGKCGERIHRKDSGCSACGTRVVR